MIKKLFCRIGFHKWIYIKTLRKNKSFPNGLNVRDTRKCKRCNKKQKQELIMGIVGVIRRSYVPVFKWKDFGGNGKWRLNLKNG